MFKALTSCFAAAGPKPLPTAGLGHQTSPESPQRIANLQLPALHWHFSGAGEGKEAGLLLLWGEAHLPTFLKQAVAERQCPWGDGGRQGRKCEKSPSPSSRVCQENTQPQEMEASPSRATA